MARKFKAFIERPKPRKRPRRHSKTLNKHKKRSAKTLQPSGEKTIVDKIPKNPILQL
jgi:hypothetical protein